MIADIVVPVPDSGVTAAMGFAHESGIPVQFGLIRNHYVGRTFIEPEQRVRDFGVKLKLNPVRHVLAGKRVVLIDDSIVRGTTSKKIVRMVRDAGAKEVHMRISCPPTISPCYYGVDTPSKNQLIGANKSVEEIREYIGADSLAYLSLEGLRKAAGEGDDKIYCTACYTGKYPTKLVDVEDICAGDSSGRLIPRELTLSPPWQLLHCPYARPLRRSRRESRGRRYPEPPHPYRNPFQRDRDRVIHARAFRRLENKTQVFTRRYSDHFRTRLTHTMEVAQISRTIAAALDLNVDLAEALALVHDIGHPPFGHAGERTLDLLMRQHGEFFDHNLQALRTVEEMELRYVEFPGLNLTFEVREGIIKHSRDYSAAEHPELEEYLLDLRPPLEAQLIDLTDEIAYSTADLDDGFEARLLKLPQIRATRCRSLNDITLRPRQNILTLPRS